MLRVFIVFVVALGACVSTPRSFDIGHKYLGAKYVLDPLGENMLPDTDPLIRFDAFDCTTFVETSLANGDVAQLNKIRYKGGKIDFLNRNHFIETDWLSNNSDILENVSSRYGKTAVRHVVVDKSAWLHKVHKIDAEFALQTADVEYIPYSVLEKIDNTEPLIVLFITGHCDKCDKIGTDIAVVHMGFLLPDGVLRHASSSRGQVVDMNFYEYVQMRREMKNNIGIALVKIK